MVTKGLREMLIEADAATETIGAQEALELHLVGEVVPMDRLMDRARELASIMAQYSPTALARTKRVLWESLETGLDDAIENTWQVIVKHTDCPDLKEGPLAFMEKRKPKWAPFTGEDD
jgi:enoyl-CoA hydratase/carnithine racemase